MPVRIKFSTHDSFLIIALPSGNSNKLSSWSVLLLLSAKTEMLAIAGIRAGLVVAIRPHRRHERDLGHHLVAGSFHL